EENRVLKELKGVYSIVDSDEPVMKKEESSKQGRKIAIIDVDVEINFEKVQAEEYNLDLDHQEKNMAGYKMNYFKGMSYNKIRPLFEKHYNYNQAFLNEVNEGIKVPKKEVRHEKEVEVESSKREGESLKQEIAKKQKMEQDTEELKKRLPIVLDDDDDVERFEKTEAKNYIDDYLLNTLKIMFEKPNVEANAWKDQKGKYGLAKMYPLTHFTLEQMVNDVILEVDYESKMYLELLRLVRRWLNEGMYPLTHFTLEQIINDVRLEVEDESEMSLEILRLVRR
nr:hypothetical protein [Tanacetum cinerariifolium]